MTLLKELRKHNNLTQNELAEILGTNQKVISSWECGRATPKYPMMQKIEDLFKVSKEKIFFEVFNYSNE